MVTPGRIILITDAAHIFNIRFLQTLYLSKKTHYEKNSGTC